MKISRPVTWFALSMGSLGAGGWQGRLLLASMNDQPAEARALAASLEGPEVAPPTQATKAVVVLIDGVGERALRPRLGALAPSHQRLLEAPQPSLSRPAYHELLTGVPPWLSGIKANDATRGRADSVPARVRASGGRVAFLLEGVRWFDELFGEPDDLRRFDGVREGAAVSDALDQGARLVIVHLTSTDGAGHAHGAASSAYAHEVDQALATVRSYHDSVARSPHAPSVRWFIGGDHGHMAKGGHGGPEPEVRELLWLAPGAPSDAPRAPLGSLAPEIALAAGAAPPRAHLFAPLAGPDDPARSSRQARALAAHDELAGRALAARVARAFAWLAAASVSLFALLRRAHPASLAAPLAAVASFVVAGPGLSLSAIRTERSFLEHGALAVGPVVAAVYMAARARGASAEATVLCMWVLAAAGMIVPAGSLGASWASGAEMVLYPSLGLVAGVTGATVAACEVAATLFGWKAPGEQQQ